MTRELDEDAGLEAAGNLLDKALTALGSGDRQKAERLARRVAALPVTMSSGGTFGLAAAHLSLFTAVLGELQASAEGDLTWLEALETLADSEEISDRVRAEIRRVIEVLTIDQELDQEELDALDDLAARLPEGESAFFRVLEDEDEVVDQMLELLDAVRAYADILDDLDFEELAGLGPNQR